MYASRLAEIEAEEGEVLKAADGETHWMFRAKKRTSHMYLPLLLGLVTFALVLGSIAGRSTKWTQGNGMGGDSGLR